MKINDKVQGKKNRKISKKELQWLGYVLDGLNARDAGRKIGLSARSAKSSSDWIRDTREKSKKPYLWDIWRNELDKQLRILDTSSGNILRELCLIAFSSIDQFVELPTRTPDNSRESIRVRYREDIPKDLIPSIASIKETKDGIEVKLHSKMDALDKLARITKLFNQEPADEVPFGGEINIHVKGTKSPLMLTIGEQQPEAPK